MAPVGGLSRRRAVAGARAAHRILYRAASLRAGVRLAAVGLRERHARGENVLDKARTLGQMLDDWIATMERAGKADNTLIAYRVICANHLKPRMGAVEVPKLRAWHPKGV